MILKRRSLLASAAAMAGFAIGSKSIGAAANDSLAGFEMPPETGEHARTFMQWPVSEDVYGSALLKRVQASIADIAKAISEFEEVVVLVGADDRTQAQAMLGGGVKTWDIPTNDLWCRDSGPTFVTNSAGELAVSQIQFNGWGEKQAHDKDARIANLVAERLGIPYFTTGVVGEQGGLEHDGAGLVLAHASSWVNPNRDNGSADNIAQKILTAIGGKKMIWAPGIIGADITDYHIDALARFAGPGKVLIQLPAEIDPEDPWSRSAYETYEILKNTTDMAGKPLEIVVLKEPLDIRSRNKDFVSSYVNYYVCNGAVICSNFGDEKADGEAQETLQQLYPNRKIVALNTDAIGESGGGIHCSTQQQPVSKG